MAGFSLAALYQDSDVRGTNTLNAAKTLLDEATGLGEAVSGQTGAAATVSAFASGISTITGLTGMSATGSPGRFLTMSGAATPGNNGTFLIVAFVSATSVQVSNPSGVSPDANDGAISWTERDPYSLEDDLNFERTDRRLVKGTTNFYDAVPTYTRPTATGTSVPANLTNIAGKTTDAIAFVLPRFFLSQSVAATNTFKQVSSAGNLKHADTTDRTGVPCFDAAPFVGAHEATFVRITNAADDAELEVLAGGDAGKLIYGRTIAGTGTSPNSVDIQFRAVAYGADLSTSVAYTWEAGHPTTVNFQYGYNTRLDQAGETAFNKLSVLGILSDGDLRQDIYDIRSTIGTADNATSLTGLLTNTGAEFVFSDLPDATPSVVEALNTLNAQIGDRTYTGPYLTSGQTIAASLQALSDSIAASSGIRYIERLAVDANANTAHTLPGAATYTIDGTGNGRNLVVYWDGLIRHPGTLASFAGNEYAESSTTTITPYKKIRAGSIIDYVVFT